MFKKEIMDEIRVKGGLKGPGVISNEHIAESLANSVE